MNKARYFLLDVFTSSKYGGNQLAIFPDAQKIDENLFQKIARELNLSETVFLFKPENNSNYRMRIFTPGKELPTAGHPTIGTGFYLAREAVLTKGENKITLTQQVGDIDVFIDIEDNQPRMVTMHQPLPKFGPTHDELKPRLAEVLSLSPSEMADYPVQEVSCGNNCLLVGVKSTASLKKIVFKTDQWLTLREKTNNAFLYIFTLNGVENGNIQGRMFAPEVGIPEDPATGSANGPLAAYLTHYGLLTMPVISLQGIEMGRPSVLYLDTETDGDGKIVTVKVGGQSVFTGEGIHYLE